MCDLLGTIFLSNGPANSVLLLVVFLQLFVLLEPGSVDVCCSFILRSGFSVSSINSRS